MNRRIPFTIVALFFVLALVSCSNQEKITSNSYDKPDELSNEQDATAQTDSENDIITESDPLAEAITAAIVEQNQGKYLPGEYYGVGYKIIETFEEDDILSIYALTEYVEYRFEDNVFVNISGTNPKVLMRFRQTEDNNYNLIFYTRLDIFSDLPEEELEALVQPLIDSGNDYIYTEQDLQEVRAQADEGAAEYLKSINRIAEIGVRQEHNGQLLEELVSDESLLKELFKDDEMSLYPDWTGTTERIENGERYTYQTVFDEERQQIIYTKIEYSSNSVVKSIVVDVQNKTITQ